MAKATPTKKPPAKRKPAAPKAAAAAAAPAEEQAPERAELPQIPKPQFSIALAHPGEDVPEGGRRFGCPSCGAKHDVVRTDVAPGQGGTWALQDFKCAADCGYSAATQPVT